MSWSDLRALVMVVPTVVPTRICGSDSSSKRCSIRWSVAHSKRNGLWRSPRNLFRRLLLERYMTEPNDTTAADLIQSQNRFDLREAFFLRQEQLLATLGIGRSLGSHPVAIGDDSELNWKGMLGSILPARYRVSKGFA